MLWFFFHFSHENALAQYGAVMFLPEANLLKNSKTTILQSASAFIVNILKIRTPKKVL